MAIKAEITRQVSGYAAFVSSPTIEFAHTMSEVGALAPPVKSRIATGLLARIQSLAAERRDDLIALAQRLQTERWKLIYSAAPNIQSIEFATVSLSEQWVRAKLTLLERKPLIVEQLARERLRLIEIFLAENSTPDDADEDEEADLFAITPVEIETEIGIGSS